MVSIKLKFRPSTIDGKEGSLYYQVIYKRVVRQVATHYKIMPNEWNAESDTLRIFDNNERYNYLQSIQRRIQWDKKRLMKIIDRFINSGYDFSVDSIIDTYYNEIKDITLFNFIENLIVKLQKNGQVRTSETYNCTLNSFRRFRRGNDLYFVELDNDLLMSYEYFLKSEGLSMNTISFYMRRLRAIYNRAVEEGLTEQIDLFKKVYTSSEKTIKRAIPLKSIKRLKALDLSYSTAKAFARDMFLFSFYTRGMSFVDIAYLQKKDLKNGVLNYRRKKTGQLLYVRWEPCMQEIIERYVPESNSTYLLNIIKDNTNDARKQYLNALTLINRSLKSIGKLIGLDKPLSMYVARHSWASIAKTEGISLSVISESMGHDSESTTQIYLASLDSSVIDKANQKIIKLV